MDLDAFDSVDLSAIEFNDGSDPAPAAPDLESPGADAVETAADEDTEAVVSAEETEEQPPADTKKPEVAGGGQKPAPKQLTFRVDGKDVPLVETAEIDWKVDGKPEKIKVRDLLDNWSGKTSYDRKFQELSQNKRAVADEVTTLQRTKERHTTLINDMHKAAGEGRVFDAVSNMLEMTGLDKKIDAKSYVKQLRDAMVAQSKAFAEMSPDQRQLAESKEEIEFLKARQGRDSQARAREQADQAFSQRVSKAMETSKSNIEEFVETRKFLIERFTADKRDLNLITPEFIGEQVISVRQFDTAHQALADVGLDVEKNQPLETQAVALLKANPTWTKKDLVEIFQKALNEKRSKQVSKTLAKSPTATAAKGAAKSRMIKPMAPDADPSREKFSANDLEW